MGSPLGQMENYYWLRWKKFMPSCYYAIMPSFIDKIKLWKCYVDDTVLCNVGFLCSVVQRTFLCSLGINYAIMTLKNLTGFEKNSRYCNPPPDTLKSWVCVQRG